jgi:hypothetical protein
MHSGSSRVRTQTAMASSHAAFVSSKTGIPAGLQSVAQWLLPCPCIAIVGQGTPGGECGVGLLWYCPFVAPKQAPMARPAGCSTDRAAILATPSWLAGGAIGPGVRGLTACARHDRADSAPRRRLLTAPPWWVTYPFSGQLLLPERGRHATAAPQDPVLGTCRLQHLKG